MLSSIRATVMTPLAPFDASVRRRADLHPTARGTASHSTLVLDWPAAYNRARPTTHKRKSQDTTVQVILPLALELTCMLTWHASHGIPHRHVIPLHCALILVRHFSMYDPSWYTVVSRLDCSIATYPYGARHAARYAMIARRAGCSSNCIQRRLRLACPIQL